MTLCFLYITFLIAVKKIKKGCILLIMLKFFKEPEEKEVIQDKEKVDKLYKNYRWKIMFYGYLAYVVSYVGRKNLSIAAPSICKSLGWTNTNIGTVSSAFYLTYGVGKFINGLLADRSNVRTFFSTAFICVAVASFCFAFAANFFAPGTALLYALCFLWGVNGWCQSMTFPPIAKSLTYWFTNSERGIRWSIISSSHQVGVVFAGIIANLAIGQFGWQSAFYAPAIISALVGILIFTQLRDKPTSLGLPTIEEYKGEIKSAGNLAGKPKNKDGESNYFKTFFKHILCNPLVWLLILCYVGNYVIRTGTEDWLVRYFVDHGDSLAAATSKIVVLSSIGIAGSIIGGLISDKVFKGKRTPVNLILLCCLTAALFLFATNPFKSKIFELIYVSVIGMCTAGLQSLIGLCIVESCAKSVASSANGFAGMFSYIGASIAAAGTGRMIDTFGWNGAFIFWEAAAVLAIVFNLIAMPMENKLKSR